MYPAAERFLDILDTLDYHIAMYDPGWRYTYVNAEAARVLGKTPAELLGHSIWDLFPDAVGNQYYRELHDAVATGRVIHSDHEYKPWQRVFENHIYPLVDGVLVLSREVTGERAAATALKQREQMLTLAQRAGGVAAFEWDFTRQTAWCSAQFFEIVGLPGHDGVMTGAQWAAFVHPDDRDRMATHLQLAVTGDAPAEADYRIVAADGTERWLSYAGQIQKTPDGDRMIGTVLDISARKRLESELRHQAREVERILESLGEGFVSLDRDFRYIYVNRTAERMLGKSRHDLLGRLPWDVFPEEVVRDARGPIQEAMRTGEPNVNEVHVPAWRRWFENRVYPSAEGLSLFFADITARKEVELALVEATRVAESANQIKDQFLATLSHELRTPLNAIAGYARMLQMGALPEDRRQRAVEVIDRNAQVLSALVDELLDMSRITTGALRLANSPVSVHGPLLAAVEAVKPAADAKKIEVLLDIDGNAPMVAGDPMRLQQIFWNLLTNAVKFTDNGSIAVSLKAADDGVIETSVRDTGVGIASEFLPFIFEPFRQGRSDVVAGQSGLGLGLAIAKRLVELHGGTIQGESDGPGRGAVITVRLPPLDQASTRCAPSAM